MPTILTSSQQTFVDITDQRKLSAYITSNLPKTQSENPNVLPHTYAPSWASTNLTLTPVVFLDQTNVALNASGLTITWKRKDGSGAETALNSNNKCPYKRHGEARGGSCEDRGRDWSDTAASHRTPGATRNQERQGKILH